MSRVERARRFMECAAFMDEAATYADVAWVRKVLKRQALKKRLKAGLALLGVPQPLLERDVPKLPPFDLELIGALTPILTRFAVGQMTDAQAKHQLMAFFDMPMPARDARELSEYLDVEFHQLKAEPDTVRLTANGISGVIETERHDYRFRVAHGWPQAPCPWGGDDIDEAAQSTSVSSR